MSRGWGAGLAWVLPTLPCKGLYTGGAASALSASQFSTCTLVVGSNGTDAHRPNLASVCNRDVRLTQADNAGRVWQAAGDERCAVQRHKPVLQPAGRGRQPGMAASAAARGGPGPEAAAAVAAWAAANPDLIARLRQRVAELMSG